MFVPGMPFKECKLTLKIIGPMPMFKKLSVGNKAPEAVSTTLHFFITYKCPQKLELMSLESLLA